MPWVTDANVLRGLLRPTSFLDGRFPLDRDAAVEAFAPIAHRLEKPVEQLAEDVTRLADVTMAGAIRVASVERGYEVEGYTLVAFGGAGSLHAAGVAEELGIPEVIVPPHPGIASAYGLLASGFRREFARTEMLSTTDLDDAVFFDVMVALADTAHAELCAEGTEVDDVEHTWVADMRYAGQGYEIRVPMPDGVAPAGLVDRFHALHRSRFGYADANREVQVVTLRLTVTRPRLSVALPRVVDTAEQVAEEGQIVVRGSPVTAAFQRRSALPVAAEITGPAVVEEPTSTCFVPPGWTARVDERTNLVLRRTER